MVRILRKIVEGGKGKSLPPRDPFFPFYDDYLTWAERTCLSMGVSTWGGSTRKHYFIRIRQRARSIGYRLGILSLEKYEKQ